MRCGLLGRKLGHSYSPQIHSQLGSYTYDLFEIEPDNLVEFLKIADFSGINVTIPYKRAVLPYCTELSPQAKKLGAVNTIVKRADGTLVGHNTDYFGFSYMLDKSGLTVSGNKVLVLGSGGASATAVAVLQERGAQVIVISRSGENNYTNLHLHHDAAVIVNATPIGMYPNTDDCPLDLSIFPNLKGVLDLIYNPAHTALLQQAEKSGLIAVNGLGMLVAQAKESAEWFTNSGIDDHLIETIHKKLQLQMENIILVGMPGCGKSTIGRLLAKELKKEFVDSDAQIKELAGHSPAEIINEHGEGYFRDVETQVLSALCKRSGLVIATGGGCVTMDRNYFHMHQNGKIIWIQRELSRLATKGRPLSQCSNLSDMLKVRTPMYEKFSDYSVVNNSTQQTAVDAIMQLLEKEK